MRISLGNLLLLASIVAVAPLAQAAPPFRVVPKTLKEVAQLGDKSRLLYANAAAVSPDGVVYVADSGNNRIVVIDDHGDAAALPKDTANPAAALSNPQDIAVQVQGGSCKLFVADSDHHRIAVFDCKGRYLSEIRNADPAQPLQNPQGVGVGRDGSVVVADTMNHLVHVYSPSLEWRATLGRGQLQYPKDAALTSKGEIWVSDFENNRLVKFDLAGNVTQRVAAVGGKPLIHPVGLDVDISDRLWAAVMDNNSIVVIDPDTHAAQSVGSFEDGRSRMKVQSNNRSPLGFDHPKGIAVAADRVWVVTPGSHSVRSIPFQ